jgi:hypothetical protein
VENGKRYEPHEAAAMLGMSGANLRRLAPIYERVYGELPRDVRRGRVWPEDAIDRLKRARDAVRAGRAQSVQAALVADRTGEDLSSGADAALPAPNTLAELIAEIRALRRTIEDQNRLIIEQGRRLEALESGEPYEAPSELRESREREAPDASEGISLWLYPLGIVLTWLSSFIGFLVQDTIQGSGYLQMALWVSTNIFLLMPIAFGYLVARYPRNPFRWRNFLVPALLIAVLSPGAAIAFLSGSLLGSASRMRHITQTVAGATSVTTTNGETANGAATNGSWTPRRQAYVGLAGVILAAIINGIFLIISSYVGIGN